MEDRGIDSEFYSKYMCPFQTGRSIANLLSFTAYFRLDRNLITQNLDLQTDPPRIAYPDPHKCWKLYSDPH
jgi:hypothetical protein